MLDVYLRNIIVIYKKCRIMTKRTNKNEKRNKSKNEKKQNNKNGEGKRKEQKKQKTKRNKESRLKHYVGRVAITNRARSLAEWLGACGFSHDTSDRFPYLAFLLLPPFQNR